MIETDLAALCWLCLVTFQLYGSHERPSICEW